MANQLKTKTLFIVSKILGWYHGTKTNDDGEVQATNESLSEKKDETGQHSILAT